jgi:capsule polysaccharide export protein KpsE/RkpR
VDGVREVMAPPVEHSRESEQGVGYDYVGLQQPSAIEQQPALQSIEVAWLLWAERRFLTRFTAAGLFLFVLLALVLPKRYTASVRLMPPDFGEMSRLALSLPGLSSDSEGSGGGSGGGKTSGMMGLATQLLGLSSSGQLFAGVLQSRTIEDDLINRFGLMKLYGVRYPEDARKVLEANTEVKIDDKTGILGIAVEDKDPQRAAEMAGAYVENLNKVLERLNSSSARRERLFIEKRRVEVKGELDDAAKEFSEFASKNAAIDIPEQAKAMVQAGADLQGQLIAAQSVLTGMQQIYTDSNPRVRQMKAQVSELARQVNKVGGKDVTPANGSVLGGDELYPSVRQLPLLGVRYLELYRRSKIDEAVYELLSKQYEIAMLEEARDVPTVQILDPPLVPQKKTSPHRTYIVLGGMCFSFLIGVIGIVARASWKRVDPQVPWKIFVREVALTCKARTWESAPGLRLREAVNRLRNKVFTLRKNNED